MSIGRQFITDLTQQAARDLNLRAYWTSGVLLLALLQACRTDALALPAAARYAARRPELAGELAELRDMVCRAGIDPDRAVETGAASWRADRSAPWREDEPRRRPHTQLNFVFGRLRDLALADPRALGADGEPDPRAVHLFLSILDHPDGAVHAVLRALGTEVVAAREAAAVPGDEWALGEVVDDRYEVTAIITAGGMGMVYRVRHRDWGVDLAVKAPRSAHFADPSVLPMFEAEARAWLELGAHPHVVACHYVARYRGLPRVMAEWVPGGSLADAIEDRGLYARGRAVALARILDIAIQTAWGLDHVHRCGLIHQDVKPGNILLAPEPDGRTRAKVTDIGLARAWTVGAPRQVEALRRAVDLAGTVAAGYAGYTPAYCSPEQHAWSLGDRQLLDRATDVWSWAATVLAMFHGHRPTMLGTEAPQLLAQLVGGGGPAPRPGPDVPALPPEFADELARCLQPYAYRPHDMNAVAERLIDLYRRLFGAGYPRERPAAADRRSTEGMVNEALSWLELDDPGTARALLDAALAQDPTHPYAIFHRHRLAWKTGTRTDLELREVLLDARRRDPHEPVYDLFLGAVELERCDGRRAHAHLEPLPGLLPHDPMAPRLLSLARRRQIHGSAFSVRLDGPIAQLVGGDHQSFAAVIGRRVHVYGPMFRKGPVLTVPGDAPIVVSVWAPRGLVAAGAGDVVVVHDPRGAGVREYRLPVELARISVLDDDETALCVTSATGERWRIDADGRAVVVGPRDAPESAPAPTGVSRDGALAVVGTEDGAAFLTEIATGRVLRTLVTGGAPVTHAYLADQERTAVIATRDGTVNAFPLSQRAEATLLLPPPGWRRRSGD
ncbi:serine/threonine-protein kinase [Nocardia sp. SSK8]|uniref:serine/threonine-protein kinase n=1 Tax=Nocardia sp. SSK8 TaxID=3120154 RepID=UPI00300B83A7